VTIEFALAVLLWAGAAQADPVDRWASEIARASARFSIPQSWIRRVMRVESGGETLLDGRPIVSRAGAMGLMQLMPGTWRDMQALLGLGSDAHDPADNILAGTAYLRLMYDRFGYPGLFAAYNAGPGRYAAFVTGERPLPAETRAYVAAVASKRPGPSTVTPVPARLFALRATATPSAPAASPRMQLPAGDLFVALRGPSAQ
jgi:soluble lytic murein transglycosylase-like protein